MTEAENDTSGEPVFNGKLTRKIFVLTLLSIFIPIIINLGLSIFNINLGEYIPDSFNYVVVFVGGLIISLIITSFIHSQVVKPIKVIKSFSDLVANGEMEEGLDISRTDEIGSLAYSLKTTASNLYQETNNAKAGLENLTKRLEISNDIIKTTSASQSLNQLLSNFAKLISGHLNLEHVFVFLLDSSGKIAQLKAVAGDNQLVNSTDRLQIRVGSKSLVGWVTKNNQMRIAQNVKEDSEYGAIPNLKEIKSEITVPISAGKNILGALDVQKSTIDPFSQDDIRILQTTADKLASVIIQNRYLENTRIEPRLVSILIQASQRISTSGSADDIFENLKFTFSKLPYLAVLFKAELDQFRPISEYDPERSKKQLIPILPILISPEEMVDEIPKTYPIFLTGIEKLGGKLPEPLMKACEQLGSNDPYLFPLFAGSSITGLLLIGSSIEVQLNPPIIEIISNLVEITNVSFENLDSKSTPVFQKSSFRDYGLGRDEREQQLFEITDKIWQAVDIQDVLSTTARELTDALGLRSTQVEISIEPETRMSSKNGEGSQKEETE